jgi:thiamine biosynthesis protein ThiS
MPAERIPIVVNGEPREVAAGASVADFLAAIGRDPRSVAVELNGYILPRVRYAARPLAAGDRIEVVHFVQGG